MSHKELLQQEILNLLNQRKALETYKARFDLLSKRILEKMKEYGELN